MHDVYVSQGGEYSGETYITCHHHDPRAFIEFEGDSLSELLAFLREHGAL